MEQYVLMKLFLLSLVVLDIKQKDKDLPHFFRENQMRKYFL